MRVREETRSELCSKLGQRLRKLLLGQVLWLGVLWASSAHGAGITAFLQQASPGARAGIGFAVGVPLFTEILTLEGEYSRARQEASSPSLTVWSGHILVVSPIEFVRLRPYWATGFGVYRQATAMMSETSFATLPGFGTFLRLGGPLHARLDYRFVRLRGNPLQKSQRRFYAGLTLRL